MGSCKQLLDLGGKTVLARCLETLRGGGISDIVVVVGTNGGLVAAEARRFPVRLVVNENPDGDMASSVRVGRRILAGAVSGVVVALCDYPLVTPATVTHLVSRHEEAPEAILIPGHGGRRGHPTLFPAAVLNELEAGGTLRDVVRRDPGRLQLCEVDDPGILLDMDTPEDYRLLQRQFVHG
jgi:CTP:molybdopterin cytidylyltransferase MocA